MDDATLAQIADEIAVLLRKHLPLGSSTTLRAETSRLKSKSCAQIFAFTPDRQGVFSVNAELRHPPPQPGELNLKCITTK